VGRAAYCPELLHCWNHEFESSLGHEHMFAFSVSFVLCRQRLCNI
jgi:hypothetical protein